MTFKLTKLFIRTFTVVFLFFLFQTTAFAQTFSCPPESHSYIIIENTEPTETENGVITYQCEICGSIYYETVFAYGHRWSEWKTVKEPTCTENGISERVCNVEVAHKETSSIPALGHDYIITIKEATCTEDGKKIYTCSTCGISYSEKYGSAFGHTFIEKVTSDASCEKTGEITHTCSTCGYSYTTETPALSHNYSEWITDKPAEPGKDGSKYKECLNGCEIIIRETIPALAETVSELPKETLSPTPKATEIPIQNTPAFGALEITTTAVNIGLIGFFFVILSGEFAFLLWRKKKLKEQKEKEKEIERNYFNEEDNYDFI